MEMTVSVLCTAYNHEDYIEQALKSFIAQKTTFPFEVLVHDDASTDGTRAIIKKYAASYPEIIRPVYQEVNQYSKGVRINAEILLPASKGKYFALCEGDDYWTDPYKLQKQVDHMQAHPECSLCIHNSVRVSENGGFIDKYIVSDKERDFSVNQVIRAGGGFCATSSIMAPAAIMKDLPGYLDKFCFDYSLQIFFSTKGKVHCIPDIMSAYRMFSKNSWSDRLAKAPVKDKLRSDIKILDFLNAFDDETGKKYHRAVHASQAFRLTLMVYRVLDIRLAYTEKCLPIYKEMGALKKIKLHIYASERLHPLIYNWIRMKRSGLVGIARSAAGKIKKSVSAFKAKKFSGRNAR